MQSLLCGLVVLLWSCDEMEYCTVQIQSVQYSVVYLSFTPAACCCDFEIQKYRYNNNKLRFRDEVGNDVSFVDKQYFEAGIRRDKEGYLKLRELRRLMGTRLNPSS